MVKSYGHNRALLTKLQILFVILASVTVLLPAPIVPQFQLNYR